MNDDTPDIEIEIITNVERNGGGGTANYEELFNQPRINGVTLIGNKTSEELSLVSKSELEAIEQDLAEIKNIIPEEANVNNKLADKAFVTNMLETSTANFRGSWGTWADVPEDVEFYPEDYSGSRIPKTNDYMVVEDASDFINEKPLEGTWRFKYSGEWATSNINGWYPEYQINESPLTSEQLAALNSGITLEKVEQIETNKKAITSLETNKVNVEEGKGLSSNDFTTAEKEKLFSIEEGAQVNPSEYLKTANIEENTLVIQNQSGEEVRFQGASEIGIDNSTITKNSQDALQAVGLTDGSNSLTFSQIYQAMTIEREVE